MNKLKPHLLSYFCFIILLCGVRTTAFTQVGCSTISSLTIQSQKDSICPGDKDTIEVFGLNNADTSAWFQLYDTAWKNLEPTGTYGIDIASWNYDVYGLFINGGDNRVYSLNDTTWSSYTTALPTGYYYSSLNFDPTDGDLYVAGRKISNSYASVWKWNGISWDTVGTMNFSGRGGTHHEIEIYDDTSIYVAFKATDIYKRPWVYRFDGTSWSAMDTVVTYGEADIFDLEISPSGVPYFAVYSDNLIYDIGLFSYNGSSWSPLHSTSAMFQNGSCGNIDIEFIGNAVYYVFDHDLLYDITMYRYNGTWSTISHSAFGDARFPSIEIDHGELVLSFQNSLTQKRQYEKRVASTWEPYFVDQPSLASYYVPKMVLGRYAFPNELITNDFYMNTSPSVERGPDIDSLLIENIGIYALAGIDSCTDYRLSNLAILEYKLLPQYSMNVDHVRCNGSDDAKIQFTPYPVNSVLNFNWSTGDTTYIIDSLSPNAYIANIQGHYCLLKDTVVITEPGQFILNLQGVSESCSNAKDGMVLNLSTGGTTPYEMAINGVAIDTGNVKYLKTGTYEVWGTDANGCRDNSTVTVGLSSAASQVLLSDDTTRTLCTDSILLHATHSNTDKEWWNWTDMNDDYQSAPGLPGTLDYVFLDRENQGIITRGQGKVRRQSGQSNYWQTVDHYYSSYSPDEVEYDYLNGVLVNLEYESNFIGLRGLYDDQTNWKTFPGLVLNGGINDVSVQHFQGYFYLLVSFDSIPAALYRYDIGQNTWINANSNIFPTGTQTGVMRILDGNQLLFAGVDGNDNLILKKGNENNLTLLDSASHNLQSSVWDIEQKTSGEILLYTFSNPDDLRHLFSYQNGTWDTLSSASFSGPNVKHMKIFEHPSGQLLLNWKTSYYTFTEMYIRGELVLINSFNSGTNKDSRMLAIHDNGNMLIYDYNVYKFYPEQESLDDSAYVHSTGLYQHIARNGDCYAYSHDVWVNPGLEIDAIVLDDVSCKDGNDGEALVTITPEKGSEPISILWSNSNVLDTLANVQDGEYTVLVTDADNCVRTDTVVITEPDSLLIMSINTSAPACTGGNNGTAKATVVGGTLPYLFTWPGQSLIEQDSVHIPAQSFQMSVIDSNGCEDSLTATVPAGMTTFSPLTITGLDSMQCTSDSVLLTGISSGSYYQWHDLTQGTWDTIGKDYIDHIDFPSNHRYDDMDIGFDELGYMYTIGRIDPNYYLHKEYIRVNLFNKVGWSIIGGNMGNHEEISHVEIEARSVGVPVIAYTVRENGTDTLFIKEWNGSQWIDTYTETGRFNHIDMIRNGSSTYFIYAKDGENFARFGEITNSGFVPIQQIGSTQVYEVQFDNNDNGDLSIFLLRQSASTIYYDASLFLYNGSFTNVPLNPTSTWGPNSGAYITNDDDIFVINYKRFERQTIHGWATLESFNGPTYSKFKVNDDGVPFRSYSNRIQQYSFKDGWFFFDSPYGFSNFYFDPYEIPLVIEGDTPYTNDPYAFQFVPDEIVGEQSASYMAQDGDYVMLRAGSNDCDDQQNELVKSASVQYDDYEFLRCPDDSTIVSAIPIDFNDSTSIVWNTGDSAYNIGLQQEGQYIFTVTDGSCVITDTINIEQVDDFQFNLDSLADISCPGEQNGYAKLGVTSAYSYDVYWADISNIITLERADLAPGQYNPVLRIGACNYNDTLSFVIADQEGFPAPQVTAANDLTVCDSMPVDLTCVSDTSNSVTWMSFDSAYVDDVNHTNLEEYSRMYTEKGGKLYSCRDVYNTNLSTIVKLNNKRWDPIWQDSTGYTVTSLFQDTAGNLMMAGDAGIQSQRKTEILQFAAGDTSIYATIDHPNYSFKHVGFDWIGNSLYVVALPFEYSTFTARSIYFAKFNGSSWDSLPTPNIMVDRYNSFDFTQDHAGNFWVGVEEDNTDKYKLYKMNDSGWSLELTYDQIVREQSGVHVLPNGTVAFAAINRISSNNYNFDLYTYDGTSWDTITERHEDMVDTYLYTIDVSHDPAGNLMLYFGHNIYTLKGNTWEQTVELMYPGIILRFVERSCSYPFITTNYRGIRLMPATVEGTGDSISVSDPGVYVPFSEKDGCVNNEACQVVVSPALNYQLEQISDIICYGDSTASISVEVISGSSPFSFDWSTGDTTETIDSLVAGWYEITVTDQTGCSQTDSIEITEPQTIDIQLNQLTNIGCASDSSGQINVSASGGSGSLSILWSTNDSTWTISGLTSGNYTALVSDTMGCIADSSFLVQAFDSLPPQLVVNNVTLYLDASGQASIVPLQPDTFFTDSCGIDSVSISNQFFSCSDTGLNRIAAFGYDLSNNETIDTIDVLVLDTLKPLVFSHQNLTVILDSNGIGTLNISAVDSGSYDNCGIASMTLSVDTFMCNDVGVQNIWLSAIDSSGNTDSTEVSIEVIDTILPSISAAPVDLYLNTNGEAHFNLIQMGVSTSDNCTIDTVWAADTLYVCTNAGLNTNWVYATDVHGNTDSILLSFQVYDTLSPAALPYAHYTVSLNANGYALISPNDLDSASTDNCSIVSMISSIDSVTCADVGQRIANFKVIDQNGLSDSINVTLLVQDTIAPNVITQNANLYLDNFGNATLTVNDVDNGSNDNCGIQQSSLSKSNFTCSDVGSNLVWLTVIDNQGNKDSLQAAVTVIDTVKPTVNALLNDTIFLDQNGEANVVASTYDLGSTDNCGGLTFALSQTDFYCVDLGNNAVTFTVTDGENNSSQVTINIYVTDSIAPVITCFGDTGICVGKSFVPDPVVSDNCAAKVTQLTGPTNSSSLAAGTYSYTYEAEDSTGNTASCNYVLTVAEYPDVDLGPDTGVNPSTQLSLQIKAGYESYLWSTGTTNNQISPTVNSDTTFWVEASNQYGCTSSDTIDVSITFVGIEQLGNLFKNIKVYPNPTSSKIYLEFNGNIPHDLKVDVLTVSGQLVRGIPIQLDSEIIAIDFTGHASGAYWIRLGWQGQSENIPVLVKY